MACVLCRSPPLAGATAAQEQIGNNSLGFVSAAPNVNFSDTLNGKDQTVTATSTTFTAGAVTLSTTATTVQSAPTIACDSGATCLFATNSISYPYTLPAATSAPTATKVFNSALNTGMGDPTVTVTWTLAIPGKTLAGSYTSTWTLSLVTGP